MSRFARPTFTAPQIPTPPAALAQVNAAVALLQGLKSLSASLPSVSLGAFSVNASLAQLKAQAAATAQNAVKTKLLAKVPKPVLPEGLQADLVAVSAYQQESAALFEQGTALVDEAGDFL